MTTLSSIFGDLCQVRIFKGGSLLMKPRRLPFYVSFPILRASDWEGSHNRRQRPHSRRISSRGRFARISPAPLDAGYGRLCIVGGGFRLDTQQFHLLRSTKLLHLSLCYFALNLMRRNSLATKH
ncbi:MAG: hypothetical protein IPL33_22135 [Sphingobacteriales bacterium]|nr:hypothetical protein [Sphingobacteriales bacterium]